MRVVISKFDLFSVINDIENIGIIVVPFEQLACSLDNEDIVFESNLSLMWLCEDSDLLFEACF